MISLSIFIIMVIAAAAMSVYCFWDWKNRIYGNIIIGFIATILFFFAGISGVVGEVQDVQVMQNSSTESIITNATSNISISVINYGYTQIVTPFHYTSLAWFLVMCGTIMSVVVALFIIEIVLKQMSESTRDFSVWDGVKGLFHGGPLK